jgi:hypothetical protein
MSLVISSAPQARHPPIPRQEGVHYLIWTIFLSEGTPWTYSGEGCQSAEPGFRL